MKLRKKLPSIPAKHAAIFLMQILLTMSTGSHRYPIAGNLTGSSRAINVSDAAKNTKLYWHPEVHKYNDCAIAEEENWPHVCNSITIQVVNDDNIKKLLEKD
jgi:hypothetical protein